jgi:hypothetical protein
MAIQPVQPQSIGGVLDTSFQLYKASLTKVWPLCLLLALASALPSIYLVVKGQAIGDPFAMLAAMSDVKYWLTYIVGVLISLCAMGALYQVTNAIGTDSQMSLGDALQGALGRTLILFVTALLFGLAIAIGTVLLVIPGLILMVSLLLSFNLVVLEGKGPVEALTGSHNLVWGHWWRTAAILTVAFIIIMVIYMAVGMVIGIVMPLIGLGTGDPFLFAMLTGVVVGVIVSLIVTPYYIALALSVYWDLKLRKEGGDLAARVGALETA